MIKDNIYNIIKKEDISNLRKLQLSSLQILLEIDRICRNNNIKYWLDSGTLLGAVRHSGFIPWDDDIDICMPRCDYERFINIINKELDKDLVYEHKYTKTWYQDECGLKMSFLKIYYLDNFTSKFKENKWKGVFVDIFPVDTVYENTCNKLSTKIISKSSKWIVRKPESFGDLFRIFLSRINMEKIIIRNLKKLELENKGTHLSYGIETMFMDGKTIYKKEQVYPLNEIDFEGYSFYAPNNINEYLTTLYGDYMKIPNEEDRVTHLDSIEINL